MFRGANPIYFGRSFGTASGLPECMGERSDFIMSKGGDAVSSHRLSHLVRLFGVLEGLAGMLVSTEMFRFPLELTGAVSLSGVVVQFRGAQMSFVRGSVS